MRLLLATLLIAHLVTGGVKPPSVFISVLVGPTHHHIILFLLVIFILCISILIFILLFIIVMVNPQVRNKAHTLPYFLSLLEQLQYPKDRIILHIRSDLNEVMTTVMVIVMAMVIVIP